MSGHLFAGGNASQEFDGGDGELQAGWIIQMTEFGASEATNIFALRRSGSGNSSDGGTSAVEEKAERLIGTTHYYADWLICEKVSVNHGIGVSRITANYRGVFRNVEATKCSIEASLVQEPIDTHPKFSQLAGKPSQMDDALGYVPDTGAVFSGKNDLSDSFQKFVTTGNDNNGRQSDSLVGINSYLRPEVVFVEERTLGEGLSSNAVEKLIDNLGERFTNLPDDLIAPNGVKQAIPNFTPDDYDDADWLLVSVSYTPRGEGGILTRKWRLSGIYGWNEIVYQKGKDSIGAGARQESAYGSGNSVVQDLNDNRILMAGDFQDTKNPPKDASYEIDDEKHVKARYSYIVGAGDGVQLGKDFILGYNGHTEPYLSAKSVTITGLEGGVEQVDINFEGVKEEGEWKPSMSVNTIVEPIDAHPNFHEGGNSGDIIGGTAQAPKNGATFNAEGAFQKWSAFVSEDEASQAWWKTKIDSDDIVDGHMPNAMRQVNSYIESGVDWTEEKYYDSLQDSIRAVKDIGYIKEPSAPNPPRIRSAIRDNGIKNWLLVDVKWAMVSTDFNSGYKVSATYRLSGNRGWNERIYEEA